MLSIKKKMNMINQCMILFVQSYCGLEVYTYLVEVYHVIMCIKILFSII